MIANEITLHQRPIHVKTLKHRSSDGLQKFANSPVNLE